ncbi:MAG: hypothetical protein FWF65_08345 [Bacteroidetes bacterium]|nr:hypothetical protein [Bacteroidota bacterium]MCL1969541.1 hypothetical protein [Bacteroidota bacterium]
MNKIRKVTALFLLMLFVGYYGGVTLFFHTHIINGVMIVHSHFHAESHHNTKSGGHTEQSITLIAQISHFDYIDLAYNNIPNCSEFQLHKNTIFETTHWVASIYFDNISLRAPPAA